MSMAKELGQGLKPKRSLQLTETQKLRRCRRKTTFPQQGEQAQPQAGVLKAEPASQPAASADADPPQSELSCGRPAGSRTIESIMRVSSSTQYRALAESYLALLNILVTKHPTVQLPSEARFPHPD